MGFLGFWCYDIDDEFKSLTGLHYQLKLTCLWIVDRNRQLALKFDMIDQQYKKKNTQRDWELTSWINPDDMFPWDDPPTTRTMGGHTILDWKELGWDFEMQQVAIIFPILLKLHRSFGLHRQNLCLMEQHVAFVLMPLVQKGVSFWEHASTCTTQFV